MANKHKTLFLDLNVSGFTTGAQQVRGELQGLEQVLAGLRDQMAVAFGAGAVTGWLWQTLRGSEAVSGALQKLQDGFQKLGSVISQALAPAVTRILELFSGAVTEAVRLASYFGEILQVFFGAEEATQKTAQAQKTLTAATKASSKALQRSLMGFDQINRLQKETGGTVSASKYETQEPEASQETQLPKLDFFQQGVLGMLRAFVDDLKSIDFGPIIWHLGLLYEAIKPHIPELYAGLKFFWDEILMPIAQWTVGELVPKFLKLLTASVMALYLVISAAKPFLAWLWEKFLVPIGQWAGETLLGALDWLIQALVDISNWIVTHHELVGWLVAAVGILALNLLSCTDAFGGFSLFGAQSTNQMNAFGFALAAVKLIIDGVVAVVGALSVGLALLITNWDKVASGAQTAWKGVQTAWQGAVSWFQEKVLDPLQNGFRDMANGVIGFLNGFLRGIVSGINAVVKAINGLSFTVPSWVPGIGGKHLGFYLKTVTAPKIPYLAQGAVLPANKPFLAMVGDQKHGTNIEAPLATIQEAVALVMQDFIAGNMAGHEATVAVLREILEAVLGISIGDDVIAGAVSRYNTRMAVVRGGQA